MSELRRQDSASSAMRRRRRQNELTRTASSGSHAGNSLRRMATHETGEYAVQDEDVVGLHTHDEHEHEHHGEHWNEHDPYDEKDVRRLDEEAAIEASGDQNSRGMQQGLTPPVMSDSTSKAKGDPDGIRTQPSLGSDGERTAHEEESEEEHAGEVGSDSDDKKKKGKFELTDQTNLLPVKQVMLIFAGLNCALFCSLLDQTMYVALPEPELR